MTVVTPRLRCFSTSFAGMPRSRLRSSAVSAACRQATRNSQALQWPFNVTRGALGSACAVSLIVQPIPGSPTAWQEAAAKTEKKSETIPAYHSRASRKPLPATLPWEQFANNPYAENGYFFASRIREVLYQQPCYCFCDRSLGHGSLLDCYTRPDKHAAISRLA